MNREQRRNLSKKGQDNLEYLNSPCTITEAVQIARGVIDDSLAEYQQRTNPLQLAISLQVEILKEAAIKAGIITEEDFREEYMMKAEEFNRKQKEYQEKLNTEYINQEDVKDSSVQMGAKVSDMEVTVEKDEEK